VSFSFRAFAVIIFSKVRQKSAYNSDELRLSICVAYKHTFEDVLAV
jgi:hypothetical protein